MTLTIEVSARPGKVSELYQTLQALIPTMRKQEGCLICRVSRDMEGADVYTLVCDWDSKASFEGYMRSGSGSALIGAIELLGESARIRVGGDARWEGIETLKKVRRER